MGITMFIYSALTEWRFLKHRFLMIKWVLVLVVFGVAWFIFGSAISGMASISDAGLHRSTMRDTYISDWKIALLSTCIELVLLLVIVFISIRKPFGVRKVQTFKYQNRVVAVLIPCIVLGIGFIIYGQVGR